MPGLLLGLLLAWAGVPGAQTTGLAPPSQPTARDHPLDGGTVVDLAWQLSPEDGDAVDGYAVYRTATPAERASEDADTRTKLVRTAKHEATAAVRAAADTLGLSGQALQDRIRAARRDAAARATAHADSLIAAMPETRWRFVSYVDAGVSRLEVNNLSRDEPYRFRIESFAYDGGRSVPVETSEPVAPQRQPFDGKRLYLLIITVIFCGAVIYWIQHARSGRDLRVRKIAGLEAVDEAVGRATEMGRSCLYVPGIQDMNDMQTIASMTILARVAKTAAEYDARVEVPTARALVMTTARETVHAAFMAAGRPDAFNEDNIYYVTDEQFGYVAYLSGLMVREKPAACFYLGSFFAESLILAETGNSIGAIQVAGTAQPAQLPFFVAACDYTLIGEEFFAASAYLSGSPEELGSLKGQDVGKLIVGLIMLVGIIMATLGTMLGSEALAQAVEYLRSEILT
jgi:hypothetical protein